MTELLDLCYDILMRILEEVEPEDLAACAQTSWAFNRFITGNMRLYKSHYLKNFDDPRKKSADGEPQWMPELQKLVKCQKILRSSDINVKHENFKLVATTVEELIHNASETNGESLNKTELASILDAPQNLDAFMYKSSLYGRAGTASQTAAVSEEDRQLSAKIHCLYGIPANAAGRRALSTHPYARARVYDLRNYTSATRWGPFRTDGSMRVDWEMLESIMVVLGYNSGLCCRRFLPRFRPPWSEPFEGVIRSRSSSSSSTIPRSPALPLALQDPFNVAGVWSRIVCFLDYNDLYHFNFGAAAERLPMGASREPLATEEAIRHITMHLKVTRVEPAGKDDCGGLPVVHFAGISRSVDAAWDPNANSRIRGSVRVTPEGEVRWTTVSIFYGGEERWRSEGIQVGGIGSQRGVVGTWFDKDYDPHGPAGPTAFWKLCDSGCLEEEGEEEGPEEWWLL